MRSILARLRRSSVRSVVENVATLMYSGDGSTLTLDFTTGVLDPRLTFSRSTLGTYVGPDGYLYGADSSTSSQTIGSSGTKTFTLAAPAGLNRRYNVGDTVIASSGANNMSGTVTSYDPSTQVLSFTASSSSGSGTYASWIIGTRMARFDYNPTTLAPRGLLIEGSASTLNQWSEDFTQAYWSKINTTISSTSVTCPDNAARTTVRVTDNSTNASHTLRRGIATSAGSTYTLSWFVKKGSTDTFGVQMYWDSTYNANLLVSSIDGNTQTVTSASGVNAAVTRTSYQSSGWYRYSMTFTHPSATGAATPDFNFAPINNVGSYVGTGNYTDFFGIQLEAGSGASSYIPTGASTAQRNGDSCVMSDITPWFNASAGTIFVRYGARINTGSNRAYTFASSNSANQIFESIGNGTALNVYSSSSFVAQIGNTWITAAKYAAAYSVDDYAVSVSGADAATDTSGALPVSISKLIIGDSNAGGVQNNGPIASFKYWNTRLSNAQLKSLST